MVQCKVAEQFKHVSQFVQCNSHPMEKALTYGITVLLQRVCVLPYELWTSSHLLNLVRNIKVLESTTI